MRVKFMIGLLCVTYQGKNYLIEYCADEDQWYLRLGKLPTDCFARITEAIEQHILRVA